MDVQDAVLTAKDYIKTLFADERVSNIGLEEVKFDDTTDRWDVTIGFFRSLDQPATPLAAVLQMNHANQRCYKIVRIDDRKGVVTSVIHRAITDER